MWGSLHFERLLFINAFFAFAAGWCTFFMIFCKHPDLLVNIREHPSCKTCIHGLAYCLAQGSLTYSKHSTFSIYSATIYRMWRINHNPNQLLITVLYKYITKLYKSKLKWICCLSRLLFSAHIYYLNAQNKINF